MNVAPQEAVLFAGLTAAAFTDLRAQRIPNALTFPMMALGMAMTAVTTDWPLFGVVGCAAAFAVHYPLFALGIERGGDAKLMMGLGACVGWREMLEASLWLAVVYLPVGLLLLAVQGRLGNLVAAARWYAAKSQGRDPGPKPEATWLRSAPIIAVAGALAWATDWLALVP
jgi:Flp pilus assembly protein protease CpaA